MRRPLHDGWTLRAVHGPVPAELATRLAAGIPGRVPGTVHTDLLAAGLIPDPYLDDNESRLGWIGRCDWRYEAALRWVAPGTERVDLVCSGLDTVATVELNGAVVARTQNMHRTYRFDLRPVLRDGDNLLAVTFAAPLTEAERRSAQLGPRPHVNAHPFNALRKMACNFGWDWGPDLATAGIWRPVALETWAGARIAAVRTLARVEGSRGLVTAHVEVERASERGRLRVEVRVGEFTGSALLEASDRTVRVPVTVEDVALWWPRSHGDQPLYAVEVALSGADGPLDSWSGRIGIRTVELDTAPDRDGTPFRFVVNGQPTFVRGANWIPADCFPHRVTREGYASRIEDAAAAGMNLLRVWGGGIYESEDFYDRCDELGILVWQDFLFACAAYAEEEPLRAEVEAEAREAVGRLANHPSLALWNGCNENLWGHADWGWPEQLEGRTWGLGYYLDVLPKIVAELDPARPYCPASPWSPAADRHPNDPDHGSMHIWDVWNERDYTAYASYRPRFVAEFGFQGPPAWATLTRAVHPPAGGQLSPDSPVLLAHQKAQDGTGKLRRGLAPHLPAPADLADWHWATSLNQARAVAFGVAHLRSWWPRCAGSVVWQLNDCWPVISWAAVDGDGRRKPLWYALRQAYRDRLLTVQPRDGGLAVVAVNDSAQPWQGPLVVRRLAMDGTALARVCIDLHVPARAAVPCRLPGPIARAEDAAAELLVAEVGAVRGLYFFAEDRDAALPVPSWSAQVATVEGGFRVDLTARALLKDVALLADRAAPDAVVDEQLVTLLPGETTTFTVRTAAPIPDRLLSADVLRCANDLVAG